MDHDISRPLMLLMAAFLFLHSPLFFSMEFTNNKVSLSHSLYVCSLLPASCCGKSVLFGRFMRGWMREKENKTKTSLHPLHQRNTGVCVCVFLCLCIYSRKKRRKKERDSSSDGCRGWNSKLRPLARFSLLLIYSLLAFWVFFFFFSELLLRSLVLGPFFSFSRHFFFVV